MSSKGRLNNIADMTLCLARDQCTWCVVRVTASKYGESDDWTELEFSFIAIRIPVRDRK